MRKSVACAVQIGFCLSAAALCLISYLEKQNTLTELRLQIPKLVKEIQFLEEETTQLQYQIQKFESPEHLMHLASKADYSHLKQPLSKEILIVETSDRPPLSQEESFAAGVK